MKLHEKAVEKMIWQAGFVGVLILLGLIIALNVKVDDERIGDDDTLLESIDATPSTKHEPLF